MLQNKRRSEREREIAWWNVDNLVFTLKSGELSCSVGEKFNLKSKQTIQKLKEDPLGPFHPHVGLWRII